MLVFWFILGYKTLSIMDLYLAACILTSLDNFPLAFPACRKMHDDLAHWLGPNTVKLLQLFMSVVLFVHYGCCCYWRVKVPSRPTQPHPAPPRPPPRLPAFGGVVREDGSAEMARRKWLKWLGYWRVKVPSRPLSSI